MEFKAYKTVQVFKMWVWEYTHQRCVSWVTELVFMKVFPLAVWMSSRKLSELVRMWGLLQQCRIVFFFFGYENISGLENDNFMVYTGGCTWMCSLTSAFILIVAMSALLSTSLTTAPYASLSWSCTRSWGLPVTVAAVVTTWALVTITPEWVTMKPEPLERRMWRPNRGCLDRMTRQRQRRVKNKTAFHILVFLSGSKRFKFEDF